MRNLLALVVLVVALSSGPAKAEEPHAATLYKNPQCSCCEGYADYLRENGFEVTVKPTHDLPLCTASTACPKRSWAAIPRWSTATWSRATCRSVRCSAC